MGAYRFLSAALFGLFLFAGLYHLVLWARTRQRMLLALGVQALLSAAFTLSLLWLVTAHSVGAAQVALNLRTGFGALLLASTMWLLSVASGLRARWLVTPLVLVFAAVALAAFAMVPLTGQVTNLHVAVTPWGEPLTSPLYGASPLRATGYSAGQLVNLFALVCAWSMRRSDPFGATLIGTAGVTSTVVLVDVAVAESVNAGALDPGLSLPWLYVALTAVLVSRDHATTMSRLMHAEDDYRAIFDQTFQMTAVLSRAGEVLDVNAAAASSSSSTPGSLHGVPLWNTPWWSHSAIEQERVRAAVGAAASGTSTRLETTYLDRRGLRWAEVFLRPLRDRHGRIHRVLAEGRDTTDSHQARAELDREQRQLHGIVQGALDAIITIDDRHRVVRFNPAAERMFGHDVDSVLGQRIEMLMPERFRNGHEGRVQAFLETGAVSLPLSGYARLLGQRATGEEFPLEATVSVVHLDDGSFYTVLCRDISDRERAEAARRQLEAQLQQSQKLEAVGQLAGGIAHDFNNLLTVINGFSDLLLTAPDMQNRQGEIGQIRAAGERAASLTRQLLTFSRHAVVEQHVMSLNDMVMRSENLLRRLLREDVDLSVELATELPCIKADPGQLERVLMNLVVNARDAMPDGGILTITTAVHDAARDEVDGVRLPEAPAGWVVLTVSDSGLGMPPEVQARLFEPFFTTKAPGRGTGLGLAVVDGVVKKAGGVITVASAQGKGTTFSLFFPITLKAATEDAAEVVTAVGVGGGETLLVVEDEPAVRTLAVAALTRQGYRVLQAASPPEALAVARTHAAPIDLLLSDVVMPGGSATSIIDGLADTYPSLKVLFMSGYPADEAVRRGVVAGEANFLQKPFTPTSLTTRVRQLLDTGQDTGRAVG
ncbi:PAS domain S-box protein [Luteitalea sp.]|uniref:PAS domain S-box protein n=1 Tax=Luteitalea sp. TaxID=2004800 RepID=UPI0037C952EF